jgi:hypothetical protein
VKGLLIRVGIDQAFGGWNAPVDPSTLDFAYVPIPEGAPGRQLARPYTEVLDALTRFQNAPLPEQLLGRMMHLDPDFETLTYGDNGERRGRGVAGLTRGDFIAFFASLRPTTASEHTLLYALIGFYLVDEVVSASDIPRSRWPENAHTRRVRVSDADVVVRAQQGRSGRLRRCIPIGEWRNRSYRVRCDLLELWGGLSCKDGFIQRSAVPPSLLAPESFLKWFYRQQPELVALNNP